MQIDGRNYLLPVDLNLRDEEELKDDAVDIEDIFIRRVDRPDGKARVVILDACRDNPFAQHPGVVGPGRDGRPPDADRLCVGSRCAGGGCPGRRGRAFHYAPTMQPLHGRLAMPCPRRPLRAPSRLPTPADPASRVITLGGM